MKHVHVFLTAFFFFILMNSFCQEKSLSLEDLLPGGNNYQKFIPQIKYQTQWFGDKYLLFGKDTMYIVDPYKPKKKQIFITNKELREFLSTPKANINNIKFHSLDNSILFEHSTSIDSGIKYHFFDPVNKKLKLETRLPSNAENIDFCCKNNHIAYTLNNNLYIINSNNQSIAISEEKNKDITFGKEVHRNEFGIYKGTFWSPKGNYLAYYKKDESMVEDYPIVDISTREASVKPVKYPMAGMKSHEVSIGIYNINTGDKIFLQTGNPKDRYFTNISWHPDESKIFIAEVNRNQDTCKLVCYNAITGKKESVLFKETNDKYIEPLNPPLFLNKSSEVFLWQSRRDGYNHLYLYHTNGKLLKQLTSGDFEVLSIIGVDDKEQFVYILSNETNPLEAHIYKINIKTEERIRLSNTDGVHEASLSFSGKYILDKYSNFETPVNLELIDTETYKSTILHEAPNPYSGYTIPEITIGTIKAADNQTDLYYRLVKPVNFDVSKKYPVIIYVYGGPHSQLVRNSWLGAVRGWDIYMAQKGYIIFTLDNRGTSNRGLSFENIIHRKLGIHEAEDQMKGIDFLTSLPYVDKKRIGIHGWSYGGFMTINMMLRYPETFRTGVAGGPVIDWKYYEIMYGERYMDTPQENKQGYKESNMNNLAEKLQGHLLIIHGDEDPVVVWQHSLSFLKSCIEKRTYPDYFVYPGHRHNILGRDRIHLYEKITRYFDDYLK